MLHQPIHAATLFLVPAFSYKCNFDFDGEVLDELFTSIQKMVPDYETCNAINRKIKVYRDGTRAFGFIDVIRDETNFMKGKLFECFNF